MDKKTQKIMTEGDKTLEFVKSDGWGIVKKKIIDKIISLNDILSLKEKDPNKLLMEVGARQIASEILIDWMREVEGEASRHQNTAEMFREHIEQEYLLINNE